MKYHKPWYSFIRAKANQSSFIVKVLNAKLRVVSILSADNDDIRFQPALAIFSTKNSYGLIFDRSLFLKFFLQVLSEINCSICELTELTWHSTVSRAQHSPTNCIVWSTIELLFILIENFICFIFWQFQIVFSWSELHGIGGWSEEEVCDPAGQENVGVG